VPDKLGKKRRRTPRRGLSLDVTELLRLPEQSPNLIPASPELLFPREEPPLEKVATSKKIGQNKVGKQSRRKVEPKNRASSNAAKLIAGLNKLNALERRDAFRELLEHAEFGPELRQLAGQSFTLAEISRLTGREESVLRRHISAGNLVAEKKGKTWLVTSQAIENFLEAYPANSVHPGPARSSS
jgi:hypothetical protein